MEFYRYEIRQYSNYGYDIDGNYVPSKFPPLTKLELYVFNLFKETPKGYWIGSGNYNPEYDDLRFCGTWVSRTAKKRYAYPTKEEALNNFIKRTESRINYLKADLDACEDGLILAKKLQNEI